jgi:hypothetical protein
LYVLFTWFNTKFNYRRQVLTLTKILIEDLADGLLNLTEGRVILIFASLGYALKFTLIILFLYWRGLNKYGSFAGSLFNSVGIRILELGLVPQLVTYLPDFLPLPVSQVVVVTSVMYTIPEPLNGDTCMTTGRLRK